MFKSFLCKAGCRLTLEEKSSNEIELDENEFVQKLGKLLKEDLSYPDNLNGFVRSMADMLEGNQEMMMKALMPTQVHADAIETVKKTVVNSVIRMLLLVLDVQPLLLSYLMNQIEKLTTVQEKPTATTRKTALLMLSSMRYLPRMVEPDAMTEKLIQLITTVPREFKIEIITVLPGLCAENQHSKVAMFLSSVFYECSDLTTCILGALADLYVPPEEVGSVRANVMKRLSTLGAEDLPNALQFVLQDLDAGAREVVVQLRDVLNQKFAEKVDLNETVAMPSTLAGTQALTQPKSLSSKETASLESIILDLLASTLGSNKPLTNTWLKVISASCETSDFTSFDLLLLITFHSFFSSKKTIEAFLKNRIKLGLIKPKLITAAFGNHSDAIQGNRVTSCLEFGEMFLHSADPQIAAGGLAILRSMFSSRDSYVTQEVMFSVTRGINSVNSNEHAIQLLHELVNDHPRTVLKYSTYLTGMFPSFDGQNLLKVRKIMDALSQLAFIFGDDNSQLSNDIYIFIRKYLSQANLKYKKIGIISAVMAAKSLAHTGSDSTRATVDSSTSSVVTANVRKAIEILELANKSIQKGSESEGLFLDELSNVIQHSYVSSKLLEWVQSIVHDDFLSRFVKELQGEANVDELNDIVPLKLQYSLESSDVALSIGPVVCKKVKDLSDEVILISPFFRLMRLVDFHLAESLKDVDALLGCGVYLPTTEAIETFDLATTKEKKIILDCLFLCLNFFRELINAFGTVRMPEYNHLVLKRITHVVKIESTLTRLLNIHSAFVPPRSQYWVDVELTLPTGSRKAKKRGKTAHGKGTKKQKTQSGTAGETQQKTTKTEEKSDAKIEFIHYREFLRELDIETVQLFRRGFDVDEKAIERQSLEKLGPKELAWLSEEIVPKFQHTLAPKKRAFGRHKASGQFILVDQLESKLIARQACRVVAPVCACLEVASQYFQSLSAVNDGDLDASTVLNDDSPVIGVCFINCLTLISAIFSWSGLTDKENYMLAKEVLFFSAKRLDQSLSPKTKTVELAESALRYYANYAPTLPYIECATSQCKIVSQIGKLSPTCSIKEALEKVIPEHLKREWRGVDGCRAQGAAFNQSLEYLVSEKIKFVKKPFEYLEEMVNGPLTEVLEANAKAAVATDLPSLSKQSFYVFYKCLFSYFVSSLKELCLEAEQPSEKDQLEIWSKSTELLSFFVAVTKTCGQRNYLTVCLKNSKLFLELFLKYGMPVLDARFRAQRDECIALLKSIQASSRQMHHICSHTRVTKDVALSAFVPALKKNLENFVYRVKAMLALNKCTEAFWIGNLKNRNLKGVELPSQVMSSSEDEVADEEGADEEENEAESDEENTKPIRGTRSISPLY